MRRTNTLVYQYHPSERLTSNGQDVEELSLHGQYRGTQFNYRVLIYLSNGQDVREELSLNGSSTALSS